MNRWSNCRTIFLTVLTVAALARTTEATITRIGGAQKLANAASGQPNDIAYDDIHGVYLVVWSDAGAGQGHIYGRFIDAASNTPLAAAFRISRNEQVYATMPRVAYSSGTGDDVFVVTGRTDVNLYDQGANIYGIRLRYNATTQQADFIGDPFPVSVNSTNPKAAQYPGGIAWNKNAHQFMITWWQDYNGNQDAFARVFNVDATPLNNDKNLSNTTWWQGAPNVAYDPVSNRYLVVYQGDDPTGTYVGAWAQLIDGATGDPIGSTIVLSAGGFQAEQSIVYLPERQAFLALWTTVPPGRPRTVVGRLVGANGIPMGDTYPLVSFAGAPIGTGSAMAAYNSVSRSVMMVCMDDVYIWGSELDGSGNVLATMQMSSAPPATGSWTPNVASGLQGQFGMSYVLNQAAVWFEQFQGSGATGPPPPPSSRPQTDFNGDGKADIVWRNSVTGDMVVWYMNGASYTGYTTLTAGDGNWRLGAVADFNGDRLPDLMVRNTVTGENQIALNNGSGGVTLTPALSLADLNWRPAAAADFNGDGKADLVWHNVSTGDNMVWFMDGANYLGAQSLPRSPDLNWRIRGAGDFNQDGKPDLVLRNVVTGADAIWYMNGVTLSGSVAIDSVPDRRWVIVGVMDLSGDGRPDIVWRNYATGENCVWVMNNATVTAGIALSTVANPSWEIMAPADLDVGAPTDMNMDGSADIVWHQAATGETSVWFMNGTTVSTMQPMSTEPDLNWVLVGSGDFNGDGKPDLVWRHRATGANRIWLMNGAAYVATVNLPSIADQAWQIVAIADFNADGTMDLLWRNTSTGAAVIWYMNAAAYAGWAALPTVSPAQWQVAGVGDLNGDGNPDIVWHNSATGDVLAWFLQGSNYTGWAALPGVPDATWKIVSVADFDRDGRPDLLWRNQSTGENIIWLLNGVSYRDWVALPTEPNPNWKVAGPPIR